MDVKKMLKQKGVSFKTMKHKPTFSAQTLAATEHVPGDLVAKVVVVRAGDGHAMLVLPASYNIVMKKVCKVLGEKKCRLADEETLGKLFPDCELGAMPPFGGEYGLPVYVDQHLADDEEIVFESGYHDEAVKMKWADYEKIAGAKVADFAEHLH
jgi:Ala-tRNA(Pro) deacylase